MKEETKRWIDKARDDLKKAKDNFKIKNYDLASFLCQQAIEKLLKAFLIEKTESFPKIHDLVRLGKLTNLDKELIEECKGLTSIYLETRYPDISEEKYTLEESERDIKIAEKILKWIEKNI